MVKAIRTTLVLVFLLTVSDSVTPAKRQLRFPGVGEQFIVYYNHWPKTDDKFYQDMGKRYRLIILNTDDLDLPDSSENTPENVVEYRKRRIRMLRDAGALVFAYLSIGEENIDNSSAATGDRLGPCGSDYPASCRHNGVASYYIDDGNGQPAMNSGEGFKSLYVNAGNRAWRAIMQERARKIMALGCDGLFLDTLDTVGTFKWTSRGMIELLKDLNATTPNIIVNRGIVLLEQPELAEDYKRLSWAVMYEDFYTEWNDSNGKGELLSEAGIKASRDYWAPKLAGKNILVVDFANCQQLRDSDKVVLTQRLAVCDMNQRYNPAIWLNYFADINFHEIRDRFACVDQ